MSVASNQLGEIHQQLKELFNAHPTISVVPISGDPPNQYQITYNIKGLNRAKDGEIAICSGHLVELTIPFGFPHFPPSCKPKSDIFHPDFDPAAICLGDVWEQDRSIVNLIVHIGKLINGDIYSTSNAFNEEAARWYETHADQFPLESLILAPGQPATTPPPPAGDIDTLDDSDLSSDFDFLSLDQSEIDEPDPPHFSNKEEDEINLANIHLLERQSKFFEIRAILSEAHSSSEEITELVSTTEEKISAGKNLYKRGKEAERNNDTELAISIYEQLLETVSDYPGVTSTIQKLRKKSPKKADHSDDFEEEELLAGLIEPQKAEKPKSKTKEVTKRKSKSPTRKTADDPFADERVKGSRLPAIAAMILLLIVLSGGGYLYFKENSLLETAEDQYTQCAKEVDSFLFEEANDSCLAAITTIEQIRVLGKERSRLIKNKAREILDSEKLHQGLAGNVLFEGQYLPKKEATLVRQFRQVQTEAEALFHQQEWSKAGERLQQAIELAGQSSHISSAEKEAMNVRLAVVLFRQPFDIGKRLLKDGNYKDAMLELEKAKRHLEKIPAASRETFDRELRSSMSQAQLEQLQKEAKDFFAASNWQEAYRAYDKTLSIAQDTPQLSHRSMMELQTNMARAELYQTIEEGNSFFSAGEWDKAIDKYSKASIYLDQNLNILNLPEAQTSRKKLDRVTLQASIIRDKQLAAQKVEESDLDGARKIYNDLNTQISNSGFAQEAEFKTILSDLHNSVAELDQKIFMREKEDYLKANFQKLFTNNYQTVQKEKLTNPVVSFVREEGEKLIFKMQCTEVGRGRPLTLVMFYAYSKKSGNWTLYPDS